MSLLGSVLPSTTLAFQAKSGFVGFSYGVSSMEFVEQTATHAQLDITMIRVTADEKRPDRQRRVESVKYRKHHGSIANEVNLVPFL